MCKMCVVQDGSSKDVDPIFR